MHYVQYPIILHEVCEIKIKYASKIKESPYSNYTGAKANY